MRHLSVNHRARYFKTVSHTDAQGALSYCPHATWDIIPLWTMLGWAVAVPALFDLNGKTVCLCRCSIIPSTSEWDAKRCDETSVFNTLGMRADCFFSQDLGETKTEKKLGKLFFDKQQETSQMLMFLKVSNSLLTHTRARNKVVICQKTYATTK